ncbi:MAG: helix-turn-helix domain-containing protein [Alkalispirochaeta sp.]
MKEDFGAYVRSRRTARSEDTADAEPRHPVSLRKLARTIGVQPSYVSKVERGEVAPPSEETIRRWAQAIEEDPDVLLAMAGKVSSDLQAAIMRRPVLFARLIRELKDLPDHAVLRIVREVRDGEW